MNAHGAQEGAESQRIPMLSKSYRVTFTFEKKKGVAIFQRMGPHSDFD